MPRTVRAEEKDSANGGDLAAMVQRQQPQCLQVTPGQLAQRRKRLGSHSEVDRFRVEFRHRLFVKCRAPRETLHLGNERVVGPAVGGTHPHVGPGLRPHLGKVVRAGGAREHLNRHNVRLAVGVDFEVRQQARRDRIAHQIGEALFEGERLSNTAHLPRAILDAQQDRPAGRVGEGDDRLQ